MRMNITMPKSTRKQLEKVSKRNGSPMSSIINQALMIYFLIDHGQMLKLDQAHSMIAEGQASIYDILEQKRGFKHE